jgi:hypothetical protein
MGGRIRDAPARCPTWKERTGTPPGFFAHEKNGFRNEAYREGEMIERVLG